MQHVSHPNYPFIPFHFHPLYIAVVTLIGGIIIQEICFPSLYCIYSAISGSLLIGCWSLYQSIKGTFTKKDGYLLLTMISFLLGVSRVYYDRYAHKDSSWIPSNTNVTIQAVVHSNAPMEHCCIKQSIILQLIGIKATSSDTFCPINKKVLWYCCRHPALAPADTIELDNITIKPVKDDNFGLYLLKEGIDATVFTTKPTLTIINHPPYSVARALSVWRETMLKKLKHKFSPLTFTLFSSLFLGNRTIGKTYQPTLIEKFRLWGISHHLARSGLHVVIFCYGWEHILRYLPLPFIVKQLLLIALMAVYALLSWSSISFLRAFLCFICYRICCIFMAPPHTMYTLMLVCGMVLVYNPVQLFFLDFQLSFLLTFALAWFNQLYGNYKI
jgi:hypothetical protein